MCWKVALVANTLCVHKLHKVQCLRLTCKQGVHNFYCKFYMEMQRSFKAFNTTITVMLFRKCGKDFTFKVNLQRHFFTCCFVLFLLDNVFNID